MPFVQTTIPHNITCTSYKLQQPLAAGKQASVASYGVYTKLLIPRPAELSQSEPQRVVFTSSHHIPSPYSIASQQTTVSRGQPFLRRSIGELQSGHATCELLARQLYRSGRAQLWGSTCQALVCICT